MTKIDDFLKRIDKEELLQRAVAESKEVFGEKSNTERHVKKFMVTKITGYIFSGVSVCVGSLSVFALDYPIWLVLPLACIVLGGIEFFKNGCLYEAGRLWYATKSILNLDFLGAVLLSCLSMYFAYKGATEASLELDLKMQRTALNPYDAQLDSAKKAHDTIIAKAETAAENFRTGALWRGSLGNNAKAYGAMVAQVDTARARKERALTAISLQAWKATTGASAIAQDRGQIIRIIIIAIECFIIGCAIYCIKYLAKASKETKLATEGVPYTLAPDALRSLVELATLQSSFEATNTIRLPQSLQVLQSSLEPTLNEPQQAEKDTIGFKPKKGNPQPPSNQTAFPHAKKKGKDSDYLQKYPQLIADLRAVNDGKMKATIAELSIKHNVHEGTIFRVKKAIFI